jgi:hypothetical protein
MALEVAGAKLELDPRALSTRASEAVREGGLNVADAEAELLRHRGEDVDHTVLVLRNERKNAIGVQLLDRQRETTTPQMTCGHCSQPRPSGGR